ncbi:hypothetical protein [Silvanigrella aquatica]|uniref:Uncharacterized protein n=1 Tax=Silvanigrella aquatica TaxID=1915309 RepID=A0A1L4CY27_9BACT|nr:hypothetical protein [Silvanigrella aquatica]APJ02863.1 hypothetical protein AXG55_02575 [Silvanigrella aquatica]
MNNIFLKLILLSMIIFNKEIQAEYAYVFCSDEQKNWHWLNNKNYTVNGLWSIRSGSLFSHYYFKIEGGFNKIYELKMDCMKQFGDKFKNAQPSDYYSRYWSVFMDEAGIMASGHKSIFFKNK